MCGFIAGIFTPDIAPSEVALQSALSAIAHRGPDGHAIERFTLPDGRVAVMAHARLALVGLAAGQQPFVADSHATVVNGEFYDWASVRRDLELDGGTFATRSDSEIAHVAYSLHGPTRYLDYLDGEWAAAIIDRRSSTLHAACDPFGTKPLRYWTSSDGASVVVASEAKAIFALGIPVQLDLKALRFALTLQYMPVGKTLFSGIGMMPPGHKLVHTRTEQSLEPWSMLALGQPEGTEASTPEHTIDILRKAVGRRIPAERSFATHLSGGLDSALILALASEIAGPGIEAFVADFDFGPNETAQARQTAEFVGASLVPVTMSPPDLIAVSAEAAYHAEGMCMNAHAGAKIMLASAVRDRGHACVLTGEGADEAFWGYEHLRLDAGISLPAETLGITAGIHRPSGQVGGLEALAHALGGHVPTFVRTKAGMTRPIQTALGEAMRQEAFDASDLAAYMPAQWLSQVTGMSPALRARALWNIHGLSGYILRGLDDAMGMSQGIESRLSFLDRNVQQAAARTSPADHFTRSGLEKRLLRDGAQGLVPEDVRLRPKAPFLSPLLTATPQGKAWARERIMDGRAITMGIIDPVAIQPLLQAPASPAVDANLMMLSSLSELMERFAV